MMTHYHYDPQREEEWVCTADCPLIGQDADGDWWGAEAQTADERMPKRTMRERELMQQICDAFTRQQPAKLSGQLVEPDDVDRDNGGMELTARLRATIGRWLAARDPQEDVAVWQAVVADQLMFLAAEMFTLAYHDADDERFAWEATQFVRVLRNAMTEARMTMPKMVEGTR